MIKIYDVDYFISKFEAIPEGGFANGELKCGNSYCAYGHCGVTGEGYTWDYKFTEEAKALTHLFSLLPKAGSIEHESEVVTMVNDGQLYMNLKTPKQRILAALRDIKKMQESSQMLSSGQNVQECDATKPIVVQELGQYKNISKQIAVLPVDEKSDVKFIHEKIK